VQLQAAPVELVSAVWLRMSRHAPSCSMEACCSPLWWCTTLAGIFGQATAPGLPLSGFRVLQLYITILYACAHMHLYRC
jgi:hypothetical protein